MRESEMMFSQKCSTNGKVKRDNCDFLESYEPLEI